MFNNKDKIQLYNGDCLEIMNDIPNKSIDLILCDLPYGTTRCKWDSILPFDELWKHYNRIIKDNGAIVLFGAEPFSSALRMSNIDNYKYDFIWEKEQGVNQLNAKRQPLRKHENISVFYKKPPTYNPQMSKGKPYKINRNTTTDLYDKQKPSSCVNYGDRYPTTILKFNRELHPRYHPTQKPVALLEYLIKTYTNEGEIVLDNCMGSGSCCIASINTNRRFIGIEKDIKYFNIAQNRISDLIRK